MDMIKMMMGHCTPEERLKLIDLSKDNKDHEFCTFMKSVKTFVSTLNGPEQSHLSDAKISSPGL